MAKKVILIRHGDTGEQYRGRYIGSTDVSLSPAGRLQTSQLLNPLRKEAAVKYLSSPARRVCETAQAALAGSGITPEIIPDLREIDFGVWEGKTFAEISSDDPAAVSSWAAFRPDFTFPGGEGITAFAARVQAVGRMIAADPAKTIAVFTHGGVIRVLICHYLALDSSHYIYFDVKPASLTTLLLHEGRGVLTRLNDLHHTEGGANG